MTKREERQKNDRMLGPMRTTEKMQKTMLEASGLILRMPSFLHHPSLVSPYTASGDRIVAWWNIVKTTTISAKQPCESEPTHGPQKFYSDECNTGFGKRLRSLRPRARQYVATALRKNRACRGLLIAKLEQSRLADCKYVFALINMIFPCLGALLCVHSTC